MPRQPEEAMSEHVVAVVATVEEAEQRFSAWLERRGLRYEALAPDDVRVDAHEGVDGVTRMRFWVRPELVRRRREEPR